MTAFRNCFKRIGASNNRGQFTILGCILGLILSVLLISNNTEILPILGELDGSSLIFYKITGIILSMGVGGNLLSYIGAALDILTNEKTIFDLFKAKKAFDSAPL